MKRSTALLPTLLSAFLAWAVGVSPALADRPEAGTENPGLEGMVVEGASSTITAPIDEAHVFAYEVTSTKVRKARSDENGRFDFDALPAGMYRLVAWKPGFALASQLLLRRNPDDRQFIELELSPSAAEDAPTEHSYWDVRSKVPVDVLRQIQRIDDLERTAEGIEIDGGALFAADLRALSGIENLGGQLGNAQLTSAEFDVRGAVGDVRLGIDGLFQDLGRIGDIDSIDGHRVDGQVRNLALHVQPLGDHQLRFSTSESQLALHDIDPVDLLRYQLDWAGRMGGGAETRVSARYMQEKNFHSGGGAIRPMAIPNRSQGWDLEGTYATRVGSGTELRAGLLYRQRTSDDAISGLGSLDESLGLFTVAENRLQPKLLVEYGIYSSVRDGSLSFMPHGGVVLDLGEHWKARSSIAQRIEDETLSEYDETYASPFHTAFYTDRNACQLAGESCYEITLAREEGDDQLSIGAFHREFSDTLRLYFSSDFFSRLESVFMVEGDELPELRVSIVRRISPRVLAKLESNIAAGGGGIFQATDDVSYQNQVRYLVTSIDTRFQATSTGVFVAFHHLEQEFDPVDEKKAESPAKVEMQRLQLMLTQDLSILADLTSKWAVRLNMELSRGATPFALTADGELYKKLTGGISVSF